MLLRSHRMLLRPHRMLLRPHHRGGVDRSLTASEVDRPYAGRMAELNMPMLSSDAKPHCPRQHGQNQS